MRLLVVEIAMLLVGIYALITGKLRLAYSLPLEGWRARVAGLLLAAPLPLTLLIGMLIGLVLAGSDASTSVQDTTTIVEIVLVVGGLAGAVLFALLTKPKEAAAPDESQPSI